MTDDQRSTGGLLVAVSGVLAILVVMVAASAYAVQSSSETTADGMLPAPTTTMSPVQPADEAITPPTTSSGVAPGWVAQIAQRTDIGSVAVDAYGAAALRLAKEQPACRLGWTTLAGVGHIESGHGTGHGSALRSDGTTTRPILGPALDGTSGMAAIASDAESERWHGDSRWDHAMGPMQFIPSTWERWESDGNDDGMADPHNVYDAAYAAGRYLCASGRDLTTATGWTQAVYSYNHSDDYVRGVLATANAYASRSR